ncbi:hypothetical protein [Streptomyces subrutilus]|uniref:hypothetical protein n=1 Tax=Streptomyces subrutilus TaxID=36818 RepID=UPI0033FDD17D
MEEPYLTAVHGDAYADYGPVGSRPASAAAPPDLRPVARGGFWSGHHDAVGAPHLCLHVGTALDRSLELGQDGVEPYPAPAAAGGSQREPRRSPTEAVRLVMLSVPADALRNLVTS